MIPDSRRRLSDLLDATVYGPDEEPLGLVSDVRLAPGRALHGLRAELVVEGLVVAHRHTGSLLGYDRRREQGPWLVRSVVTALHRHDRYVRWTSVREVDWAQHRVHLAHTELEGLSSAS
jgi:hypothetical protein